MRDKLAAGTPAATGRQRDVGRRNRVLSYTLATLWAMHFGIAYTTTFYEGAHLSFLGIFVVLAIMIACNALFEVFFGWCADGRGAKRVLLAGLCLQIVSSQSIAHADGFWQMTGANVLTSMSWSMVSGTTGTIVAASSTKQESDSYNLIQPICSGFGAIVAVLIGLFVQALSNIQWVFSLQPLTFALGLLVALFLTDSHSRHSRTNITPLVEVCRTLFIERADIRWRMLLAATVSTSAVAMLWLIQPDQKAAGINLEAVGFMYGARATLCLLLSLVLYYVFKRVGVGRVQLTLVLVISVSALFAGMPLGYFLNALGGLALAFATACDFACTNSLVVNDIKNAVDTDKYTTAQSVYNALKAIIGLAVVPVGVLKEHAPANTTLLAIGATTLVLGLTFHYLHSRAVQHCE